MFKSIFPQFIHKATLKKKMLDELRDYPRVISEMLIRDYGDGVIKGTDITWENEVLTIGEGLLVHHGQIYRMEEDFKLDCPCVDRLTFLKIRFITTNMEMGLTGGVGEIYFDDCPPETDEIELGRFRLQEGARLRTEYENVEDYQTEFDTLNRIHMPWLCPGGMSLWPRLILDYGTELLDTGTEQPLDVAFAMQALGSEGQVSKRLLLSYLERKTGKRMKEGDNGKIYKGLIQVLREGRFGQGEIKKSENRTRQMLLL